MGTAAKRLAYVAGQGADVGSLATDDSHSHLHGVGVEVEQLQTVYHQHLGLQVDLLALACQVVGPVPVDLACREGWGYLLNAPYEALEHLKHTLTGDMPGGIGGIHLLLQVEAGGGGTQLERGHILLGVCLQLTDEPGGPAHTDGHDACCQGVERAGMAHLELLDARLTADEPAHLGHEIEARPA